jgi:hypothetical protein
MNTGTIYKLNESRCEVVIQPETRDRIVQARQELGDNGFTLESANILGNFSVRLSEERGLKELQSLVVGEVVDTTVLDQR